MTHDINYGPIAEACADAVDNLADAILDCIHDYHDVKPVVQAVNAAFYLGDITDEINLGVSDSKAWIIATILPCRPTMNPAGYTRYFTMLARVVNSSPRFKEALEWWSGVDDDSYFPEFSREILMLSDCLIPDAAV